MSEPQPAWLEEWADQVLRGDTRAMAAAISAVENRDPRSIALLQRLFPHTGRATLIGVTGASGSGKSTLVDRLAAALRQQGHPVAILAVDPTSPFTGGAILGDRLRMQAAAHDPGIFVRSLATRGALGGLSSATLDAAMVLDAAGKQFILVETVGVGQDEVDIAQLVDVTLLLLVPQMGDDVQVFKAGVMEIADVFVINKADLPAADRLEQDLRSLVEVAQEQEGHRQPTIVRTVAIEGEGVSELLGAVTGYVAFARSTGAFDERRLCAWRSRLLERVRERALERVGLQACSNGLLNRYAVEVATRQRDPYSVADEILEQAGRSAARE